MGFMDKARATATDLAAKADTALGKSGMGGPGAPGGDADRYFRDLGVLTYLETNGRPVTDDDRDRLLESLRAMESQGTIGSLTLQTAAVPGGAVPPPPGGAVPPPPGGAGGTAPPPPGGSVPPSASQPQTPTQPPTTSPPPPPTWMGKSDAGS